MFAFSYFYATFILMCSTSFNFQSDFPFLLISQLKIPLVSMNNADFLVSGLSTPLEVKLKIIPVLQNMYHNVEVRMS